MTQRNEDIELILEELERYGLRGEVGERGKHLEVAWETPVGRRFVIASRTPSDWRSGLNTRSDVRKLLRADNMQPKAVSALSFQKAMSLPKEVIINRELILQKDVDALTDLVFDMQSQLSALQDLNNTILEKMNSVTVVSRVQFGAKIEKDNSEQIITEQEFVDKPAEELPFREGSVQAKIYEVLTCQFQHVSDIEKLSGVGKKYVARTLWVAKGRGFVELGLRGMYRRKQ